MYENGTILKRREPVEDADYPYNFLEVVGESPMTYANTADWTGAEARGVIVQATFDPDTENGTPFAPTLDEPVGKLNELYEIVSVPELVVPTEQVIKRAPTLPTPEEAFKEQARIEHGEKQARAAQFTPSKLTPEQQFRSATDNETGRESTFPPAEAEEAEDVASADE